MKQMNLKTAAKTIFLTVITFGIYGAFWIMKNLYEEPDIHADEGEKETAFAQRAVTSVFLSRHDFH
jgi:hypothetical protein